MKFVGLMLVITVYKKCKMQDLTSLLFRSKRFALVINLAGYPRRRKTLRTGLQTRPAWVVLLAQALHLCNRKSSCEQTSNVALSRRAVRPGRFERIVMRSLNKYFWAECLPFMIEDIDEAAACVGNDTLDLVQLFSLQHL